MVRRGRRRADPTSPVSERASGSASERGFARTSAAWATLAEQDPLWAVLVEPGRRHRNWDVGEFLAAGRTDVDGCVELLRNVGVIPGGTALDFGCGAGRLTQALAGHVDHVIGVDVSPAMLEQARAMDQTGGACTFRLATNPDLDGVVADSEVDLVLSLLVLQHLPRELGLAYLPEFARVLAPGGVALLEFPTGARASVRGLATRVLPHRLIGRLQTAVLRYPAPMRMTIYPARAWRGAALAAGFTVVAARQVDEGYAQVRSPHWVMTRVVLRRDG